MKVNPCVKVDRNKTSSRARILSDSEIPKFWNAFDSVGPVEGMALKMILLTGQRPGEVSHMRTEHLTPKTKSASVFSLEAIKKGVAIRVPKLDRGKDNEENEHINAILRGSLNMVAAMLKMNARIPITNPGGVDPTEADKLDYDKALQEIAEGIKLQLQE